MNDDELTAVLKRAAGIVERSDLPADLRQAAFTQVLGALGMQASNGRAPRARQRKPSETAGTADEKGSAPTKARRAKPRGPKTFIMELVDQDFFAEWKTLADVQDALEARGRRYKQSALSPALLSLTQDGILQRSRKTDEGNRKHWVYKKAGT